MANKENRAVESRGRKKKGERGAGRKHKLTSMSSCKSSETFLAASSVCLMRQSPVLSGVTCILQGSSTTEAMLAEKVAASRDNLIKAFKLGETGCVNARMQGARFSLNSGVN